MSRFLLLVCLILGLVVTGCGGEKKTEGTTGPTKEDEKGSSEKRSMDKDGPKKEEKAEAKEEKAEAKEEKAEAKEEKAEAKEEKAEAKEAKADDKGAAAKAPAKEMLVSLKLPNMT